MIFLLIALLAPPSMTEIQYLVIDQHTVKGSKNVWRKPKVDTDDERVTILVGNKRGFNLKADLLMGILRDQVKDVQMKKALRSGQNAGKVIIEALEERIKELEAEKARLSSL